jgi:alkaline phosphatase D
MKTSRRTFLLGALAVAAAPLGCARTGNQSLADPFTLGVASGDPAPDGVVLWTRLAPNPLADDGLGGMPSRPVDVGWEIAADNRFQRIERRGTGTAVPDSAHSLHVELTGLRPGRDYFYRFRAAGYLSPIGRTHTAPETTALPPALTMCFASCSQYEHGWFTAYRSLAEDRPDLVLHLGSYQYEYPAGRYVAPSGNVRVTTSVR